MSMSRSYSLYRCSVGWCSPDRKFAGDIGGALDGDVDAFSADVADVDTDASAIKCLAD